MQTECWQTCELSNFPGVRLICGRDFKMSDMNFFTPVALLSVLLFFAVKMSLGCEFSENHVPVKFISTLTYQQHTLMYGNRQFPRIYNAIRWYLGYFCAKFGNLKVFSLAEFGSKSRKRKWNLYRALVCFGFCIDSRAQLGICTSSWSNCIRGCGFFF